MATFHIFRDSKNVLRGSPDVDFADLGDQVLFVNTTAQTVEIQQFGRLIVEGPADPMVPAHQPRPFTLLRDETLRGSHPFKIRATPPSGVNTSDFQALAAADPEIIIT